MEISNFYFSIIFELLALILILLLGFVFLLRRDKNNLTGYVSYLKEKVDNLTKKLKALEGDSNPGFELMEETVEYIKSSYEEKYGHKLGEGSESTEENNSKEHFLYVLGFQGLKATLTSLENSNNAENTWNKISSQMSALIENFRIMPETEYKTIISNEVKEQLNDSNEQTKTPKKENSPHLNTPQTNNKDTAKGSVELVNGEASDQFIQERKDEISRLKSKISNQFEEIWKLQGSMTQKLSNVEGNDASSISDDLEVINRQLKDSQLCITMMEADIATADEEILELKEQLQQANIKISSRPASNSEMTEDIKKKDALIARFSQESKEMLTLMDGMEASSDEQYERIKELESQLAEKS